MKKVLSFLLLVITFAQAWAQHTDANGPLKQLRFYEDSLTKLGNTFINNPNELQRKTANYTFIKTLVSALKVTNSYLYKFDSVKSITLINSPDNKFRIFCWHVMNDDGSYRFYGSVQMNTGGPLQLIPLEDLTPLIKNPEDSISSNRKWYGAQYYQIIPVYDRNPYYVLLGWKGNTVESTKKVIDVLSFRDGKAQLGLDIFDGNGKTRKRVVFEYARQASMLLRYVPEQHLIVFDHLAPPDKKQQNKPETYGPDLSYNGYRLKNGRWEFVDNLDMRNIPEARDQDLVDPKKQAQIDKANLRAPVKAPIKH